MNKSSHFAIKHFELIRIAAAVLIGFALALVFLLFVSKDPVNAIRTFILEPFQSTRRFFNIIELAIPLLFTSLGMCFMLRVGEFNLIVEGGFMLSGAVTAWLASTVLPADFPPVLFPAVCILAGAVVGGICGAIPALLNIKWNANVVVVTIMLNYVLTYASTYVLRYWMRDNTVTYLGSNRIAAGAKLPVLLRGTDLHAGIFIVILAAIFTWWFLNRTTKGFEIKVTGQNRSFAKYIGINVASAMLLAQIIGGALGGIGGAVEILGKYDRFLWTAQTGYGFSGLMITVLARNNPIAIPFVTLLFAYLQIGANIVGTTTDVPSEFVMVIQAIIILLVAATLFLDSFRKRAVVRLAQQNKEV